ncbi:MAG: hypothetical protein HOV70_23300, partial [Streptomyces sp.]|nr:hypothetical protein [Streptomyces sp.]
MTDPTAETDEQRADREETERDHARGDHTHCGVTCEVEMPTEHLRNFVIAKGYPGTAGALAELERRAAAGAVLPATTDQTAEPVCRDAEGCHRVVPCDPGCGTRDLLAEATRPLPAPVDRAAVLREAADIAEAQRQFEPAYGARKSAQVSENVGILRVAEVLRRMADETPATRTGSVDQETVSRALDALRAGNHITARRLLE